ncbi:hypothetical protein [Argonema galeatum]|uniref:hypothetical protein n=1 Tax=Argonema galeatum TaxID=2942762 RepID=UPI0020123C64|nr:hypothetical protein [Argonema galeatum]MCL1463636.1 hypothetical protein [Argonema galeatum A003/A1]
MNLLKAQVTSSRKQVYLLVIYLIPLCILLWFIASFGINTPFWDQMEFPYIFQLVATGKANFETFFNQHNEHRIFFPKLIITALAFASKWDIRYELYTSVFLTIITFLCFYKISLNQAETGNGNIANIFTCMLLFSLVQWENWLWGFQIAWFLINTCVAIAILILYSCKNWYPIVRIFLAAIFCCIASFSTAHGLMSWLALIPLVVSMSGNNRQKLQRILIWLGFCIISVALYSIGYQKIANPSIFYFLQKPLHAVEYFFTLLGSPLFGGINYAAFTNLPAFNSLYSSFHQVINACPAKLSGLFIFISFLFLTVFYLINWRQYKLIGNALPWLSLGLFAVLYAISNTFGRAASGDLGALISRYTTPSLLLIIALVQVSRLFCERQERQQKLTLKHPYKIFVLMLMILVIIKSFDFVAVGRQFKIHQLNAKTCLELIFFIDYESSSTNCLQLVYPNAALARQKAEFLDKLGMRTFPQNIAFITKPSKNYGFIDNPRTTEKSLLVNRSSMINLYGWAILPDSYEQPIMVLISYGNERYFLATTPVNLDSPDIEKFNKYSLHQKARWAVNISAKSLPIGETVIKAWVYDRDKQQFVKLSGKPKVLVQK